MNMATLIQRYEGEASGAVSAIRLIKDTATTEGRSTLTAKESRDVDALFARHATAQANLKAAREIEASERLVDAGMYEPGTPTRAASQHRGGRRTTSAHIGYEARTYRPDLDPKGTGFIQDVARNFLYNDPSSSARLARHTQEEAVERPQYSERAAGDGTTANWSGLIVPQYLVDMVAPAVANMRPFADAATNHHDLPPNGMSVNISRVTTPSQVGLQGAELAALPAQSVDDTLLTIPVLTAGGSQNLSRQSIDRGIGIDETVLQDLFNRYASDLDNQMINQATTGLTAVASANTWSQATPTGAQLYGQIQQAAAATESAVLNMAVPSHCLMHSRRWYWLSAQLTATYPMVNFPEMPPMATAVGTGNGYASGVRGYLPNGLAVVVDNNISTVTGGAQDLVFVVPSAECHLWEDPNAPAFIRAEQPNAAQLGVLLVVYGYYAYTHSRYTGAMQKITGTGLVTPVFPG